MPTPKTYDEWLALGDAERESVKESGLFTALRDGLRFSRPFKVYQVEAGTYHGGEWVIHAYVEDEQVAKLPNCWDAVFEGFRVYWLPVSSLLRDAKG